MIPLRDNNPTEGKPYVVYGLVALNALVFIAQQLGVLDNLTMIPYSVLHDVRVQLAAQYGRVLVDQSGNPVVQNLPGVGPHPQWITIFTSMFMHGGLMHIGGNMLYLWIFGNNIEDALGHVKFLLFYLLCGVLAALLHIYASIHSGGLGPYVPTLGASGAIAGVLGAYIVLYPKARIDTLLMLGWFWQTVDIPAVFVLGVWFVLQLTGTFGTGGQVGGGVAYWAHVGGFVSGALIILILGGRKLTRPRRPYQRPWNEDRPYPFRPWK
jgi:membrane associated rhomboid family serine protease